ncbi:MAG: cyclic pyranopterin monophosphate synthase MoaC [SAR202 cluster bacterium]|nr:cyclic pyranopterin monophosphate synthase MoaC [Chloroflexota bacterium]MQG22994.1 cyclic pyranopterin monophosphate synthase MoaC [SAR202 cluster bacterium]|tara:strand:+ start:1399 stop:1881 length:483 start_codon:yes stop_codon:yes gene_type:complete
MSENKKLTHLNRKGEANMVNIKSKEITDRIAVAIALLEMKKTTIDLLKKTAFEKGDVLSVARVAGIMASKKTSELIPLCHPLAITKAGIEFDINEKENTLKIESTIETTGKTGVEMEALTAASVAALTVYDMCKSVDKEIKIKISLVSKKGGKSGDVFFN